MLNLPNLSCGCLSGCKSDRKWSSIIIKHRCGQRLRVKIPWMGKSKVKAEQITDTIQALPEVKWFRLNIHCQSLVIVLQDIENEALVLDRLEQKISPNLAAPSKQVSSCTPAPTNLRRSFMGFLGLTAVTAWIFVRETIVKVPLSGSLFSPLGMISLAASLPLWKKGLQKARARTFSLDIFLAASCTTAIIAAEAAAAMEILWITSGSHLVKDWITERSRNSIRDILQVTAKKAYVLAENVEVEVDASQLQAGDLVVVHSGEKIPVDGEVEDGQGMVDEASITGRSEFILKKTGQSVYAGTFVRQGVVYVRATKVGDETYLSRILCMVEESLQNKAPMEGAAEDLAKSLMKLGAVTTLGTLLITQSWWRAFTVMLIMACPCATVLSASTAISAALSLAAKRHILIKGGRYLEESSKVDIVCFDKTGTLTTNTPCIEKIYTLNGTNSDDMLRLALAAEQHNSHPVAEAIKAAAEKCNIERQEHARCDYHMGCGVEAKVGQDLILVGNEALLQRFDVDPGQAADIAERVRSVGMGLVYLAKNKTVIGAFSIDNSLRPEAVQVISRLKQQNIRTVLISGDEERSAAALSQKLGLDEYHASVMPKQKQELVAELMQQGKVLMIGDGINDALALAQADVGVAMGAGGTEVAIEAADIALVKDDLTDIVFVRELSDKTLKVIKQNFWIASGSNLGGVVFGALGMLNPIGAGLLHIGHSLGVLANSSRLLAFDKNNSTKQLQEA